MGKTLLNKFGNVVKRSVLAGLIGLSFAACEPVINPTPNYTPTALFSAPTNSIKVGENLSLTADGKDDNGKSDIIEYEIAEDKNGNNEIDAGEELIKQNSPIVNYSWTSTKAGTFNLIEECKDKAGATGKANLEIVVSDNVNPTNYAPNIISNPIMEVNEKNSYNYQVNATDSDGDKLTYSIIGPSWLSIDSSTGLINGTVPPISADTNCDIEIEVSDGTNVTKQNFTLTEKNLLDLTGNLQDVETLATQAGEVRLYDASNNSKIGTVISSDGNFSFHETSPVAQVKLQAQIGPNSYIRTLTLNGTKDQDLTNKIRVTKYGYSDGSLFDATSFRDFIMSINYTYGGIAKWNLNELKGVEILSVNPNNPNNYFTPDQQIAIENRIKNPTDIGAYVIKGRDLSTLTVQKDSSYSTNHHYTSNTKGIASVESGWIFVIPDNNVTANGSGVSGKTELGYFNSSATGIINNALITIVPQHANDGKSVLTHEFGHAFIAPDGEATLSPYQTIMNPSNVITTPGVADVKAGKIIYENTYLPREKLNEILGMNWMN
ncbi:Uncharacterised protein [uncultured archaeon]|nr:Uncharacterised protein [uncultured archaeon]